MKGMGLQSRDRRPQASSCLHFSPGPPLPLLLPPPHPDPTLISDPHDLSLLGQGPDSLLPEAQLSVGSGGKLSDQEAGRRSGW